jgi:hypothetical protein
MSGVGTGQEDLNTSQTSKVYGRNAEINAKTLVDAKVKKQRLRLHLW